jgi:hypothetical protein
VLRTRRLHGVEGMIILTPGDVCCYDTLAHVHRLCRRRISCNYRFFLAYVKGDDCILDLFILPGSGTALDVNGSYIKPLTKFHVGLNFPPFRCGIQSEA